jgi:tetratricopeptide (TPR) repeat protein
MRRELAEQLGTEKSRLDFADWLSWIGDLEKDLDLKNLAYYEAANILRNLPQDFNTRQNLRKFSSLLNRIGDTAMEQNEMDAAVRAFEERLEIHWSIEEVESTEYSLYDLCNAQTRLAEVYQKTRREIAAHKLIREGLVLSAKLPDYWRDVMTEGFVNLRDATKSNS